MYWDGGPFIDNAGIFRSQLSHWSLLQVSIQVWWVDLIQEIDSKVYSTFLYDSSLGYTVHVY